jgi:NADH:ubiquinone oxidoreductase subunit F (NADH-binding)
MPEGTFSLVGGTQTLAEYTKQGGFSKLTSLRQQTSGSKDILNAVREAKLRGRGGSGMPTAAKWDAALAAQGQRGGTIYLVCNAYDADNKSQAAATLTTNQPFIVIESIALAAYALGVREAYIYMRSANRAGYAATKAALYEAQETGVLGDLTIHIVGVDVGFMGGEESTMLEVIRGRRAMAVQRPPYPAQVGLDQMPTVVDNIETLAQIVTIMNRGVINYTKVGSTATPGTKLITLYSTEHPNGTIIEVPFGTAIAQILKQAGINISEQSMRGVVVGGPEGGVLPLTQLDTPFDFEQMQAAGAIVGSGVIEVLPATTCMVEWARARSQFLTESSCGKCIPCRTGTKRIAGTLAGIISDVGQESDLALLGDLAEYIPTASLCGFGWHATRPLKTAQKYFADDFAAHLKGECPTGTCIPVRSHRFTTKGVL